MLVVEVEERGQGGKPTKPLHYLLSFYSFREAHQKIMRQCLPPIDTKNRLREWYIAIN